MIIDFYGRSQVDAVGDQRMGYVEPRDATAINPDPIAVVRGAEHPELAIRFIEFVLSDEGQRLWNIRATTGGPRFDLPSPPARLSSGLQRHEQLDRSGQPVHGHQFVQHVFGARPPSIFWAN